MTNPTKPSAADHAPAPGILARAKSAFGFDSTGKSPQPGTQKPVPRPVGKPIAATVSPAATKSSTPPAVKPPTVAASHVSVPIATLQAMHAQLQAHADNIAALIPAAPEDSTALAAATAARLKAQGAAK